MSYLEGESIKPSNSAEAKKLIGTRVQYLRKCDIDRSGRGYVFPQYGTLAGVRRNNLAFNSPENWNCTLNDLVEMVADG
jgi:hypothetical protein